MLEQEDSSYPELGNECQTNPVHRWQVRDDGPMRLKPVFTTRGKSHSIIPRANVIEAGVYNKGKISLYHSEGVWFHT